MARRLFKRTPPAHVKLPNPDAGRKKNSAKKIIAVVVREISQLGRSGVGLSQGGQHAAGNKHGYTTKKLFPVYQEESKGHGTEIPVPYEDLINDVLKSQEGSKSLEPFIPQPAFQETKDELQREPEITNDPVGRVIKTKPKHQGKSELLSASLDVLHHILDHLDPIDRTILRYTCKTLFDVIPKVKYDGGYGPNCAKSRVISRLLDTELCPKFRGYNGYLGKDKIMEFLRRETHCPLCRWFAQDDECVRCPFHYTLDPYLPPMIMPRVGLFKPRSWFAKPEPRRMTASSSHEEYVQKVKREFMGEQPRHCNRHYNFVGTWSSTLCGMFPDEIATAASSNGAAQGGNNTNNNANHAGPIVDNSNDDVDAINEINSVRSDNSEVESEGIISLVCCSHCLNALPNNSYVNKCLRCRCSSCGWTEVEILRFWPRGDKRMQYVPLGRYLGANPPKPQAEKAKGGKLGKLRWI